MLYHDDLKPAIKKIVDDICAAVREASCESEAQVDISGDIEISVPVIWRRGDVTTSSVTTPPAPVRSTVTTGTGSTEVTTTTKTGSYTETGSQDSTESGGNAQVTEYEYESQA